MPYPIEQSPLYKMQNKRKLCQLLGTDTSRLRVLRSDNAYRVYWKALKRKSRQIEEPSAELSRVQGRIHSLLSRIKHPNWLFSGIRGLSYIDNAAQHAGAPFVMACDVRSFYQSVNTEHVFRFFHGVLKQSIDVAWVLTDIVTFMGHLPTGSPSSPVVAFRAYESMFREIHDLAYVEKVEFSLYVDDMTFSGRTPLRAKFLGNVKRILRCHGLQLKDRKTKYYGPRSWKPITGVAISQDGALEVPNRLHHSISLMASQLRTAGLTPKETLRLHGLISSARQISPWHCSSLNGEVKVTLRSASTQGRRG